MNWNLSDSAFKASSTICIDSLAESTKWTFRRHPLDYESEAGSADYQLIEDLLKEINDPDNLKNTLDRYNIDTNRIKAAPLKLLKILPGAKDFSWNRRQTDFISKKLTYINDYKKFLDDYLGQGSGYGLDVYVNRQYIIKIYQGKKEAVCLTSRKYAWGFMYPWTTADNRKLYSFKIENILDMLLGNDLRAKPPLLGRKMLKYLAEQILEVNTPQLNRLAPYDYEREIDELKATFKIVSFSKITGDGGYFGEGPLIQIILKNPVMLPNVSIEFLASIHGDTIYPRDSVKKYYKQLVKRVQAIDFIRRYLAQNARSKLRILFFDDKPINQYNIDGVNKNPGGWKHYDGYVKSLDWYKKNNVKPLFDLNEVKKTDALLDCGCNYRFSADFMAHAIMFLIEDSRGNLSRWFLLPDNTVLLYITEGGNPFGGGANKGLDYPCRLFDKNGNMLSKANSE